MFDPSRIRLLLPATLTAAVLLAACGGGGGGAPANQPPVAKAVVSEEAVLNVATLFDTAGSLDPEGKPVTRSWDYGDGQTGTADSHVYTSAATFTAVHTVTDDQGAKAPRRANR